MGLGRDRGCSWLSSCRRLSLTASSSPAVPGHGFPGVLDGETVSQTFLSGPTGFRFRQARFAADEHRPVMRHRRGIHNAGSARLAGELEACHAGLCSPQGYRPVAAGLEARLGPARLAARPRQRRPRMHWPSLFVDAGSSGRARRWSVGHKRLSSAQTPGNRHESGANPASEGNSSRCGEPAWLHPKRGRPLNRGACLPSWW